MNQSARPVRPTPEDYAAQMAVWESGNLYHRVNETLGGTSFVFVDGPPYANGGAHLGHALNKVWKDTVVKSRWYMGQSAQWTPGWDCHGLPLELQVDKLHPHASLPEKMSYCKELALTSVNSQMQSFKALGCHADWQNPYLTFQPEMKKESLRTLYKMYSQGLLQYKMWPVHHCPACASSLAEAELEYEEKVRLDLYFKYPLSNGEHALVWTTTAWTLPMNQALAFNRSFTYVKYVKDKEVMWVDTSCAASVCAQLQSLGYALSAESVGGSYFEGLTGTSPLLAQSTPVLHADFVESGKTGFVHVACAHGPEDYELGAKANLQPLNLLDTHGKYQTHPQLSQEFHGVKNSQAAPLVVQALENKNLLVYTENTKVEVATCWRHKTAVYYQATWQVFLDLDKLKPRVRALLGADHNLGEKVKQRLQDMLLSRPHWCLSRQRYWGTRMELLVNKNTQELSDLNSVYMPLVLEGKHKEAQELLNSNPHLFALTDVLDVWFDSGNVVQALGLLKNFECADMVLEGKDQYRGWFQSLLWLSVAADNKLPYHNVLVHGFVLDANKEKFSKSKKNGVSADEAVAKYNPDVMRLWALLQEPEVDAVFSDTKLKEVQNYYQRFRLSLRFLSSNAYKMSYEEHKAVLAQLQPHNQFDFHNYVLKETLQFVSQFKQLLLSYQFRQAVLSLYEFCDKFLSQWTFEVLKQPLYLYPPGELQKDMAQCLAYELTHQMAKCLSVFTPFVAQEFYTEIGGGCVFLAPTATLSLKEPQLPWDTARTLRRLVHTQMEPLQREKVVRSASQLEVTLHLAHPQLYDLLCQSLNPLFWLGANCVVLQPAPANELKVELRELHQHYKCARCWNYFVSLNHELCTECDKYVK